MDYIHFCNDKGSDLDTVHILVNDYKDRLKDENQFLRTKMEEEGWKFHKRFVIDPCGFSYPFHWGMDREPEPSECYYFHTVIFLQLHFQRL